jgi:hypothetical protein
MELLIVTPKYLEKVITMNPKIAKALEKNGVGISTYTALLEEACLRLTMLFPYHSTKPYSSYRSRRIKMMKLKTISKVKMNLYTTLTDRLKVIAEEDTTVKSVRKGLNLVADIDKKTCFPSVHIRVVNATPSPTTMLFEVEIFAMALRGFDNVPQTDRFKGAYEEDTNLDAMLDVLSGIHAKILSREDLFRLVGEPSFQPFYDSYMNNIDGWFGSFQIEMENDVDIC